MPIILPTPDEIERLSWYERERTIARAAKFLRALMDMPAGEGPARVVWLPSHATWAEETRAEAVRLWAAMGPDPEVMAHRTAVGCT